MVTLKDILGLEIVGFRYGKAPSEGRSYNTREREYESGVSMAKVGYGKEVRSFAIDGQSKKKYYYIGKIAGTGGDDEICLENIRPLTKSQYEDQLVKTADASNLVVDFYADRKKSLIEKGYDIGMSIEEIEKYRNKYKRMTKNKTKKAKFRVGQLVSVPWDNLKHKVKSKYQNSHGYWHYYITGLSGEFSESDLSRPTKTQRKKYRC